MPTKCRFAFARVTPIFYSGEQINGSFCLTTTKELAVEAIKLTLVGYSQVEWTDNALPSQLIYTDDYAKDQPKVYCSGRREHLNQTLQFGAKQTLQPGEYRRDFCFNLSTQQPANMVSVNEAEAEVSVLPASSTQQCGEIAYVLNLVLERKSAHNKTFMQRIVIKNKFDLNRQPHLQERTCINSGGVELALPCTGFVPGQLMQYSLRLSEKLHCKKIHVNLVQVLSFKCLQPVEKTKRVFRTLSDHKIDRVLELQGYTQDYTLRIPLAIPISSPSHPSSLMADNCLIGISYEFEVVSIGAKNKILQKIVTPLTIGTVPLRSGAIADHKVAAAEEEEATLYCYDNMAPQVEQSGEETTNLNLLNKLYYAQQLAKKNSVNINAKLVDKRQVNTAFRLWDRMPLVALTQRIQLTEVLRSIFQRQQFLN